MKNVLRTLIYNGQVSLTLADTTALVREGIRLHRMTPASAYVFGKAISAMTFMSACLKEATGEISLSIKGNGGEIAVSGNSRLSMRGFIEDTAMECAVKDAERVYLGNTASLTVIRDDGYNRPFVGACATPDNAGVDEAFEEYFRISEQLPTRIKTVVEMNGTECVFAGIVAVQPLPFADESVLQQVAELPLEALLSEVKQQGVTSAEARFGRDNTVWEEREAKYQCNCSREYLTRVLVSLGETQMRSIIKEDGAVRVHCHYCNTDYEFTEEDADLLFKN